MKAAIAFAVLAHSWACARTDADLALLGEEEQADDLGQEDEWV